MLPRTAQIATYQLLKQDDYSGLLTAQMFDLIKTGEIDFVIRNEGTALRYLLRLSDV